MTAPPPEASSERTPTRFCYVVLAHRNVDQVLRVAGAIRERAADAEVVLAFNGDLDDAEAEALAQAGVRRVGSGRPVDWGGYNLLASIIEALGGVAPDAWAVLVSGDSYPVRDLSAWQERILASKADAVLRGFGVGHDPLLDARVRYRWRTWVRPHHRGALLVFRALNAVGARLGPRPRLRTMPQGIAVGARRRRPLPDVYLKGSGWFALGPGARARLLELAERPDVRDLFHDSLIPDESFVYTLAAMDSWDILEERVMFVVWPGQYAPHPVQLGPEHADAAMASGAPFARKLDGDTGEELADLLDSRYRSRERPERAH